MEGEAFALYLLGALVIFALRTGLAARKVGEARRKAFASSFPLSLLYYVLLGYWASWELAPMFFLLEGVGWLGVTLYWEAYRAIFATGGELRRVEEALRPSLGPPEPLRVEEEAMSWFSTVVSSEGRVWESNGTRVWLFPHAQVLKESGSKWWIPALPKGVWKALRERGREGDLVLLPFAIFPETSYAYVGKYHVLLGEEDLRERVLATLAISRLLRLRLQGADEQRRKLLELLKSSLPEGFTLWGPLLLEDKGRVDALIFGPCGEAFPLFIALSEADEAKARELSKWFSAPSLLLTYPPPRPHHAPQGLVRVDWEALPRYLSSLAGEGCAGGEKGSGYNTGEPPRDGGFQNGR